MRLSIHRGRSFEVGPGPDQSRPRPAPAPARTTQQLLILEPRSNIGLQSCPNVLLIRVIWLLDTSQKRYVSEPWLASQGQLRLAPSGHVVGLDMSAALNIGAARRSDLAALSELLPAAEAGLVEALCRGSA
jgi:hypothetical protein